MSSVILAPFSNSDIRDWPLEHYAELAARLLPALPAQVVIRVTGTRNQRLRGHDVVRRLDPARVVNDCGRLSWAQLMDELRGAACVIGNNSGIAHLSGRFGAPTVCVFGGSHQRLEWRPRGGRVVVLSRVIACSPCGLDHGVSCTYEKACLRQIEPAEVADAVLALIFAAPAPEPQPIRLDGQAMMTEGGA